MSASKDERDRILQLVEAGRVSASQAAELLDTLDAQYEISYDRPIGRKQNRTVRVRATSLHTKQNKVHMIAALPVGLIKIALRMGSQLIPQLSNTAVEDLLRAIDNGATGRLLDLQDLENGERLEIFVE